MTQKKIIEGDFEYTVKNEEATILGLDFFRLKDYAYVTVPPILGGYPVTLLDTAGLGGWRGLRKITIPNFIAQIADGAFSGYKDLRLIFPKDHPVYKFINEALVDKTNNTLCAYIGTKNSDSYIIPSFVTSIGAKAFAYCSDLRTVTIPNSVTSIGKEAFIGCRYLNIIISKDHSVYSFANATLFDTSKNILFAYFGAKDLHSYIIPHFVTSIATSAFAQCRGLKKLKIPNSVTHIGENAFARCRNLREVTLPQSITIIERWSFVSCTRLAKVTIPNSVTKINDEAFTFCRSLLSLQIGDSVRHIGDCAFYGCSSLVEVIIPSSVTHIGKYAFHGCPNINKYALENKCRFKKL